jgi:SWI/SNF-related matrix-associated actin-dependent regulator 1 of chromatin subfamily A
VYNLEVEGNHNYFTDGVLVANCKEPSTTWTKLITSLSRGIPKFIALTGTPVLSRPKELFTTLNMISPHEFPDPWAFYKRYCDPKKTRWGWEFKGSSNVEELKDRIATHYIRRTKGQVLPYLPAKVRVDHEVPLDKETAKEYRLAEADFVRYLEKSKDTKTNVATVLTQLNELRRLASIGKIDGAIDLVDDLVESGEKVIVFSAFNEPLKELKNYFGDKAVMIIGETTTKDREAAVGRFQEDDTVRVFLGGLRSSGEGITLTKGSSTVFLDYSWVPAEQEQAENRNHRPGVEHQSVTIYQLYTEGTIDDKMRCVNESKKELFEKLFGDGGKASDELVNGVIDSYRKGL